MSYIRTQEILESQLEMLFGQLCKIETEGKQLFNTDMTTYTKAIRETAKTLLRYYTLEVEPMPTYIAEALRQLDTADAAMMETQAADRLHNDLGKLEKAAGYHRKYHGSVCRRSMRRCSSRCTRNARQPSSRGRGYRIFGILCRLICGRRELLWTKRAMKSI